jgi:hypothetical protein
LNYCILHPYSLSVRGNIRGVGCAEIPNNIPKSSGSNLQEIVKQYLILAQKYRDVRYNSSRKRIENIDSWIAKLQSSNIVTRQYADMKIKQYEQAQRKLRSGSMSAEDFYISECLVYCGNDVPTGAVIGTPKLSENRNGQQLATIYIYSLYLSDRQPDGVFQPEDLVFQEDHLKGKSSWKPSYFEKPGHRKFTLIQDLETKEWKISALD